MVRLNDQKVDVAVGFRLADVGAVVVEQKGFRVKNGLRVGAINLETKFRGLRKGGIGKMVRVHRGLIDTTPSQPSPNIPRKHTGAHGQSDRGHDRGRLLQHGPSQR